MRKMLEKKSENTWKGKKVFASEGTFKAKIRAHPPILLGPSFANSFGGMNRVDSLDELGVSCVDRKKRSDANFEMPRHIDAPGLFPSASFMCSRVSHHQRLSPTSSDGPWHHQLRNKNGTSCNRRIWKSRFYPTHRLVGDRVIVCILFSWT